MPTKPAQGAGAAGAGARCRLRLYLAGDAPNSVAAAAHVRSVLAEQPDHGVELETIDVLVDPQRALRDGVLVTPMLVRVEPLPERRILGNLRNLDLLREVLGLAPSPT